MKVLTAATVNRPRQPAPITSTVSSGWAPVRSAAWMAQASGSVSIAAPSVKASGTSYSWDSWATSSSPQPPPVSWQ